MQIATTTTYDIPDNVMTQLSADLITTAVEGGINYWASASNYRCPNSDPGATRVTVYEDDDEGKVPHVVDVAKMNETVAKLVAGDFKPFYTGGYDDTYQVRVTALFRRITASGSADLDNDGDYDFDAGDADCMLQLAVFGEVVYG